MFHFRMHLPTKVSTFRSRSKEWKVKTYRGLDRALLSGNVGTNIEGLHTPTSIPKKPKGDDGNRKKKLELDKVLYENKAW